MTTAIVWLLLISFAGHMTVTPMPSMEMCKALVEQAMDGNRTHPAWAAQPWEAPYNIQRAQCLDGSER